MTNPNFSPDFSTNQIYIDTNNALCLTDTLEEMETDINGKAESTHTHTEYAPVSHTHSQYAETNHAHTEYAATNHTHSGYASTSHTHEMGNITGLSDALSGKAAANHTHSNYAATNHEHSYNDLNDKPTIPAAYTHPSSHPASMITGLSTVATSGSYNDLSNKPTIPTIPDSLPASGGNADTVDNKHARDFATADHIHTPTAITESKDLNDITTAGIYSFAVAYAPTNRPDGTSNGWLIVIPWNSNSSTQTIKQIWLRHGSIGENDHEMYVRTKIGDYGWSDWVQTWTTKDLNIMSVNGDVTESWTNQDVVAKALALGSGMYTVYSRGGTTNNPKTTESWRFLIHKTGSVNYGWVLAFGANGSVYAGYIDNGSWKGWKCIYDSAPAALWSGVYYMSANQTVTPTKKLSECKNGWVLIWSDYDPDTSSANDGDFVTSVIYKRKPGNTNWNGESHYFDIPRYIGSNTEDTTTEKRIIKRMYVYDSKLVGYDSNKQADRNDVVLRAIYEF